MIDDIPTVTLTEIHHILVLIGIIIVMGLLGGISKYMWLKGAKMKNFDTPLSNSNLMSWLLLGVCAAFTVPLMFYLVHSDLIVYNADPNVINYLYFAGLCVIAAIFSRSFLTNIYDKIMKRMNEMEVDISALKKV